MTHNELKALLREWYEKRKSADRGGMASVIKWMEVDYRLKAYARTLCEGGKVTE